MVSNNQHGLIDSFQTAHLVGIISNGSEEKKINIIQKISIMY